MLFGSHKKDEQVCLVFDVGSNSVAGSWVRYEPGKRPVLLYTKRISIDVYQDITVDHLLFAVKNALREVLTVLVPQAPCAPHRAFVFMASPWYAAQVRTISYARRQPFVFSKRFADDLVMQEFDKFNNAEHKEWKNMSDGHVPLEHKIVNVELNGYTYNEPIGKKAERAEISAFMSMMPENVRDDIENIIHSSFHVDVEFHTSVFASYYGLSHMKNVPSDYTIVDVRGETTDLAVVRDGYLQEVVSLPFGDHTIVRSFAELLNHKPVHMQELIDMYLEGHLDDVNHNRIDRQIGKALEHVESFLHTAFAHVAERGLFPHAMYVYSQKMYQDWYARILSDGRFAPLVTSNRAFSLHEARTTLKGVVTDEQVILDPFIVAGAFFASNQLAQK